MSARRPASGDMEGAGCPTALVAIRANRRKSLQSSSAIVVCPLLPAMPRIGPIRPSSTCSFAIISGVTTDCRQRPADLAAHRGRRQPTGAARNDARRTISRRRP